MPSKFRKLRNGRLGYSYTSPDEIKFKDRKPEDGQLIAARPRCYKTYVLAVYRASDDRVLRVDFDNVARKAGHTSCEYTGWIERWKNYDEDLRKYREATATREKIYAEQKKDLDSRNG